MILVNMDEVFTMVNYSYNEKGKNDSIVKKIPLNSKISDNGKKIFSSKIFYDTEKKS